MFRKLRHNFNAYSKNFFAQNSGIQFCLSQFKILLTDRSLNADTVSLQLIYYSYLTRTHAYIFPLKLDEYYFYDTVNKRAVNDPVFRIQNQKNLDS